MSNHNTPVDLRWKAEYQEILDRLDEVMEPPGMRANIHFVARRLLLMLRAGLRPSGSEVVSYIYNHEAPRGGWIAFDEQKWLSYVPTVVDALRSDSPWKKLHLGRR